jgi:hypothetical protein
MENYCSLCTFKVPQGANNLILCTLDTIHILFFVTRLIINKINKVQSLERIVITFVERGVTDLENDTDETIWVKVRARGQTFLLCNTYRPDRLSYYDPF